jgi:hypothetical protein
MLVWIKKAGRRIPCCVTFILFHGLHGKKYLDRVNSNDQIVFNKYLIDTLYALNELNDVQKLLYSSNCSGR